jgi:hypothetical protein
MGLTPYNLPAPRDQEAQKVPNKIYGGLLDCSEGHVRIRRARRDFGNYLINQEWALRTAEPSDN